MQSSNALAAAIAGVLASSAALAASPVPPGGPYGVTFNIAGSSAAQGTIASIIGANCQAGSLTTFNASGATTGFNAYSCVLNASLTTIGGAAAIFYYRADGGSVTGVGPFVSSSIGNPAATHPGFTAGRGSQLLRLDETACDAAVAGVANCTIGAGYNGNTDAAGTGLVYDWINLGISDLEPTVFQGENWGTAFPFVGPAPTKAALTAITSSVAVFDQVFTLIASNAGSSSGVTNLSRQSVANIFSGTYSDWGQVPTDNTASPGSAYPAGTITVCRRDPGSGTQAGASIIFEDQGCNASAKSFVKAPAGPFGNPVQVNLSTGSETTCVSGKTASIGFVVKPASAAAGTHFVSIDGNPADQTRAALGQYPWIFELTFNHLSGSLTNTNQTAAYNFLLTKLAANTTDPASPNIVSVPNIGGNVGTLPLTVSTTNHIPIALGTRSANSCAVAGGVN